MPLIKEVFQYSTDSTPWPDLEQEYTLYKYDAAGRRMQVNGAKLHNLQRNYAEAIQKYTYAWQEVIEPHDTQYRYNGEAIYLSYKTGNSISNPNARWLHGAGVDEPLIRYGSDGSINNYHQNGRNSAVLTTSANDGSVVASQQFGAFGNVQASSGTINQYGYTGREPDASGLMYYRARYYDPQRGRFLQRDPKGYIDGINLYAYAANDPVNRIDPRGTVSQSTNNYNFGASSYFSGSGVDPTFISGELSLPQTDTFINVPTNNGFSQATQAATGLLSLANSLRSVVSSSIPASIANPVPSTLARVVPNNPITRASGTLGKQGADDVFVTGASDIRGLSGKRLSDRLTINPSPTGFRVTEFTTPRSGIASPVNRANPGFVGGGRTAGGAREFIIPNQPIPPSAITRVVK